jgi:hypothetical protein
VPVKSYTVGPGVLTLGEVATPMDFTSQVKSARVVPKVDVADNVPVLSGEELQGERTYSYTLDATLIQDLGATEGVSEWSWTHKGETVPFTYTPSTAAGKSITGMVIVDPMELGGDAKSKPTSDISWSCVGEPEIGADLT